MSSGEVLNLLIVVTVFGLILSVWCICVVVWLMRYLSRIGTLQKRLGLAQKESDESKTLRLWRDLQQEALPKTKLEKPTIAERLEELGRELGWQAPLLVVFGGMLGVTMLGFVAAYILLEDIVIGIAVALAVMMLFYTYIRKRFTARQELFERQLLDALAIAARALRAGHPLVGALQLVSEEIGDPLGGIFYRICREQELGLELSDSIHKVAKRTPNAELKLFGTAVVIQSQTGGNLADLMDSLSAIIRARVRLNRRVRVITAQTQFSKKILIAVPIVAFLGLHILNPQYMQPLYDTHTGRILIAVMILSVVLGSWLMNRMSVIRY